MIDSLAKRANKLHVIATEPERSPSALPNEYAALVLSRKKSERKTRTLVAMPAWLCVEVPKASNAVTKINTVVQPCHRPKGR